MLLGFHAETPPESVVQGIAEVLEGRAPAIREAIGESDRKRASNA
jgi:hypothetical protein